MHASLIVVVDDDPDVGTLIEELLQRRGYRVISLESGAACLDFLREQPADIVITDMMMPGISGIELCRELRARHPELRAIVLTGLADRERARAALGAGACDVLHKPSTVERIELAIRRALATRTERHA